MAHYNIFREQLAITYPAYGYALWEPGPSSGRLYRPVEVGDVGYVREGKFHRLFNALLPADDPSHLFGVPEDYEQLIPRYPDIHIDHGTLGPSHYYSTGINVPTEADYDLNAIGPDVDGFPQVSFLCTRQRGGAVLSLPVQAQRQDTRTRADFGRHILKHINRWLAFTRWLGLGIEQMEEIVLITGYHRTKSSANVAFLERQEGAQVSFASGLTGVCDDDQSSIRWRFSPERIRGAVLNCGPGGNLTDLPEDQCIFIRGFRVARVLKILPRQLRGAAGPTPDLDGHDGEPDMELISIPTATEYWDPLHLLLVHVAKRAPDCDMVLVHDDDLARLNGICDINGTLQPDAVMGHLKETKPEILHILCDQLFTNDNKSRTDTETVTVAMFSKEFQEWDLPLLTSTSSRTGSTYSTASEMGVDSDNNKMCGDVDDDPLVMPPPPSQISYVPPHLKSGSLVTSTPATEQLSPQLVTEPETYTTNGVQQYILMSHGNDYALVEVSSRGPNDQDPLLHIGEELAGAIVLSPGGRRGMRRIDLVLQVFESNLMIPSAETKCVLLPHQVDSSHLSGGEYRWPFSIPPPPVTASSASSSSAGHSSLGHRFLSSPSFRSHSSLGHRSYDRKSDPEFKLVVIMHRPGLFTRNIEVRQQICYVAPPDPFISLCSSPIPFDHPPMLLTDPSWSPQNYPSVMVRGVMFSERDVEVECKLLVPHTYPTSDIIPLRLTMISESLEALDLVQAAPDAIDVRLLKVMGFGEQGKIIQPFALLNRSYYHRTDLVAEAKWEPDGHPKELTSQAHSRPRWHIEFNGNLLRKGAMKLGPSFEGKDMVIRYIVCLYRFRAQDFRPEGDPRKPLLMANIPLGQQR